MKKVGIVAFAFGVPWTIHSNQRLADIATQKARELNASVYTQHDMGIIKGVMGAVYIEERIGNPPSSLRMSRQAVQWARACGFTDLWIVAAKPHLWRCKRDLTKAVEEVRAQIVIHVCPEIELSTDAEWFCPDSTQPRTRSRQAWERREGILRHLPFWLYKLVAS